jgi:hypothetical protein
MNFKCSICGKEYDDLTSYMNCVNYCVKKEQKKDELKRLVDGVKDALDTVNKSKDYLKYRLDEFKEKFPEEYNEYYPTLMSVNDDCVEKDWICDEDCDNCPCNEEHGCYDTDEEGNNEEEVKNFLVEIDSSNKNPKIKATVNGKPVGEDVAMKLISKNPEVMHLAKTLGILPEVK